ncbi:MAG: shikimate dehydrogenase [Spirochaetota bacterium]
MLCLTLTGSHASECIEQFREYRNLIHLVEIRLDLLSDPDRDEVAQLCQSIDVPIILTCRRKQDGGAWEQGEKLRTALLLTCLELGVSYIDLEEDYKRQELEQRARELSVNIIRSYHDTRKVPEDMFARLVKLSKRGDIAKIAVTPQSITDTHILFNVERELADMPNKIVIGMGEWGIPTRILYKRTGSLFTYCSPEGTSAASGHLSAKTMAELYRADRVTQATQIFGVVGNPVMHTSSPMIHNPAFHQSGLDAIYVPFLVDNVRSFFKLAERLPVTGFSVTVPHKQQVLPFLGRISREVKLIGSCNTVVRKGSLWKGLNTDFYGFLQPIQAELEAGTIRKAVVIGAGGAARSVVWALRNYRCKVVILNRTAQKARKLAEETNSQWDEISAAANQEHVDLIVQTTSVGMEPNDQLNPVPDFPFSGREIAYELVYKPQRTAFIQAAEQAGCRVVYGMQMLLAQGKLQFESFTGLSYPQEPTDSTS